MRLRKKNITIRDIADDAGVSFKTVSRIINGKTTVAPDLRDRVLKSIRDLGYRPSHAARALAGTRGFSIAMLLDRDVVSNMGDEDAYRGPFFTQIEAAALRACQAVGYRFVVETINPDSGNIDQELAVLNQQGVDGVLLTPPYCDLPPLMSALEEKGMPYVRFTPGIDLDRGATVCIDNYSAGYAATRHLLDLGHRHIHMVAGLKNHLAANARVEGYLAAMADVGCSEKSHIAFGDFMVNNAHELAKDILRSSSPPSAIFAANDAMALGVIRAAGDLGLRLPDDLSVVGFDDSDIAIYSWPTLTTIHQPVSVMTRVAVEYLLSVLNGEEKNIMNFMPDFHLVERKSTKSIVKLSSD